VASTQIKMIYFWINYKNWNLNLIIKIFNIENLEKIIINNGLVLSDNIIVNIKKIFPKLDKYYIKYYKLIQKWKKMIFQI
jgi:hypothetical protein